jgi:hypothetical protein
MSRALLRTAASTASEVADTRGAIAIPVPAFLTRAPAARELAPAGKLIIALSMAVGAWGLVGVAAAGVAQLV